METANDKKLKQLDKLAWLLDSSIRIPGTSKTIGIDGIIGLMPGVGDMISGIISSYIVVEAVKTGVSSLVITRMLLNIFLETIIGVIPVFGDIFDFIFKANRRNVHLMRDYIISPATVKKRSGIQLIFALVIALGVIVFIMYLLVIFVSAVFSLLSS